MSGQLEERYVLNEREAKVMLISSLMKHVLKSPKQIDDDELFDQENAETVDCCTVSHPDSEIMLCNTVTWDDMKFERSKIVFNARDASNIKHLAKYFVLVVACCKALPRR